MTIASGTTPFAYEAGEEVVLRLAGIEAFDLKRGGRLSCACMPAWTIGAIISRRRVEGAPAYVIRFEHHDAPCLAIAEEALIDGTA
jgi:hypothetical protein